MAPGQVHTWMFKGDTDGYIINFSEEFLGKVPAGASFTDRFPFFSGNATEQSLVIPLKARAIIEQIFENILAEDGSGYNDKYDMIRAASVQLFIHVKRNSASAGKIAITQYSPVITNFKTLIETHYKEKKLTKDYASLLFITPNHLNALSRQVVGRSAGELIRERILLEAKRLLVNAEQNINEIASELNFADNSYFSKFFKKYTGTSPEIFRNKSHQ